MHGKIKEFVSRLESIFDEKEELDEKVKELYKEKDFIKSFEEDLISLSKCDNRIRRRLYVLQSDVSKLDEQEFKIFFEEIKKVCDKRGYGLKVIKRLSIKEAKKTNLVYNVMVVFFSSAIVIACMLLLSIPKIKFALFFNFCYLLFMACYVRLVLISLINIFNITKHKFLLN